MDKRVAYVGLSTPVYYDYKYPAKRTKADLRSSPNPILDCPYGLLLLYDEIWFLTKSLCPQNMRGLPYVKFIDEMGIIPNVDLNSLHTPEYLFGKYSLDRYGKVSQNYQDVREFLAINWEPGQDNHTHGLKVGNWEVYGNSWDAKNVVKDLAIHTQLPENVDFITNTFTERLFVPEDQYTPEQEKLCHILVLDHIINYSSPQGPYHPIIDEAREDEHLKDFRKFIANLGSSISEKDIKDIKKEIAEGLKTTKNKLISQHFDKKNMYIAFGKTLLSKIPLVGPIFPFITLYRKEKNRQKECWQAFLLKDYPVNK